MKVIEQKIRSLYHSTVFLWLLSAFFHIFSFSCVCLCRHFVWFSSVPRPRTQILSVFIVAAILNKFPLSVDKSVTWFLLCARVFSPAAAILESEKTLGTRLLHHILLHCTTGRSFQHGRRTVGAKIASRQKETSIFYDLLYRSKVPVIYITTYSHGEY